MDPSHLLVLDATVTRRTPDGGSDDHGNPTVAETTETLKVWVEQQARGETTGTYDRQADTWRLYAPPGADLAGVDAVTVGADTWELDGPPWPAVNPRTGKVTHVEATMRRVR